VTKPVISSVQQLVPLFIEGYDHYLPTAFNESMSLLQKVNKVIKGLEDVYTITNSVVEQWNAVMEWVLGEGLNDTITTRLDAMVADGTFESIIDQAVLGKPDIIVSATAPAQFNQNTFWYQTV
jgi:hypothetical protein